MKNHRESGETLAGTARERLIAPVVAVVALVIAGITVAGGCHSRSTPPVMTFAATAVSPAPLASASATPIAKQKVVVYVTGAVKSPGVYALEEGDRLQQAIHAAGGFRADAQKDILNLAERVHDTQHLIVPRQGEKVAVVTPPPPVRYISPPTRRRSRERVAVKPAVFSEPIAVEERPAEPVAEPWATQKTEPVTIELPDPMSDPVGSPAEPAAPPVITVRTKFRNPGDGVVNLNTASAEDLQQLPLCGTETAKHILAYRQQIGSFTDPKQLLDIRGIGEKTYSRWIPFIRL